MNRVMIGICVSSMSDSSDEVLGLDNVSESEVSSVGAVGGSKNWV